MGPHASATKTDVLQKLDKLARIRDNQRKSRARKQEHIRELEQKLALYQKQAHQKDVEHRLTVQRLETENRRLKSLLVSVGVPSNIVEGYLRTTEEADMTRKVAIPAMKRPERSQCQSGCARSCSSGNQTDGDAICREQTDTPKFAIETAVHPETKQNTATRPSASVRSRICGNVAGDPFPTNEDILNTTLCAIAEELISQYNTRGVDLGEIQKKLWAGFTKGCATGEDCRVQNHILFQVLDEISSD